MKLFQIILFSALFLAFQGASYGQTQRPLTVTPDNKVSPQFSGFFEANASDIVSSITGTTEGTVAAGDDSRFLPSGGPGVLVNDYNTDPYWLEMPMGDSRYYLSVYEGPNGNEPQHSWRSRSQVLSDIGAVSLSGSYSNPSWITALAWSKITGAADLAAIEALTGTGLLSRTAADTWTLRTLTAGGGISVSNGTGASGNPTVAVDSTVIRTTGDQSIGGKKGLQEPFFVMQQLAVNSTADDWVQLGYLNHPQTHGSVRLGVQVSSSGQRAGYLIDITSTGYGSVPSVVVNYSSTTGLPEIKGIRFRRLVETHPRLYVDVQLARTVNPNNVRAYVIAPVLPDLVYGNSWVWQMEHNPDPTGTTTIQTLTLPAQTRGIVTNARLTVTDAASVDLGGTLGVTGNTTLGGTLAVTGAATLSSTLTVGGAATLNGQPSYASASSNTALTKSMGDAAYQRVFATGVNTSQFTVNGDTYTTITGTQFATVAFQTVSLRGFAFLRQLASGAGFKVRLHSSVEAGTGSSQPLFMGCYGTLTRQDTGEVVAAGDISKGLEWEGDGTVGVQLNFSGRFLPRNNTPTVSLQIAAYDDKSGDDVTVWAYESRLEATQ